MYLHCTKNMHTNIAAIKLNTVLYGKNSVKSCYINITFAERCWKYKNIQLKILDV